MQIFTRRQALRDYLNSLENKQLSVGFVPTMGALHQGHISLLKQAKQQCDLSICSIFVNPNQFNDPEDLKRYPRTPEKDADFLKYHGCDVLFLPERDEIYPEPASETYDFGPIATVLEGAHRPGHFNGVAQVLQRLFNILQADKAFFGEKDYQQILIVKSLVKQLGIPTQIVPCPIVREADGLAMSSRNVLLGNEERILASRIPVWLNQAVQKAMAEDIESAKHFLQQEWNRYPDITPEYFEVCHPENLEIYSGRIQGRPAIALMALTVGKIRLIDNLHLPS